MHDTVGQLFQDEQLRETPNTTSVCILDVNEYIDNNR
jgi:hypothetical protein